MKLVVEDPTTYKVDVFFDEILGSRAYLTPSLDSPNFYNDELESEPFDAPSSLVDFAKTAGNVLSAYGAGYISIDFMRVGSDFAVIEANTSGVGIVTMWSLFPDQYVKRYSDAILCWLSSGGAARSLSTFVERCSEVDNIPWAYDSAMKTLPFSRFPDSLPDQ
jgi:hypothetical protein